MVIRLFGQHIGRDSFKPKLIQHKRHSALLEPSHPLATGTCNHPIFDK